MKTVGHTIICAAFLITGFSNAHAVSIFGTYTSGSELDTPGTVTDGGPGSVSASISRSNFNADAGFLSTSTYLPELTAYANNPSVENDDDRTWGHAQAYRVFNNSGPGPINLNVSLHGIVNDGTDTGSYVLADVWIYGGSTFEVVSGPQCSDGTYNSRYMFEQTYFCGNRTDRANLYIGSDGDITIPHMLTIDTTGNFGVYAILRANAKGGSADATQTLKLDFENDEFITALDAPSAVPLPATVWLFGARLLGLLGFSRKKNI